MTMDAARLEDLAQIEAAIWAELSCAMHTKSHPWRVGVLATRDGEGADARSVVVREVDADARNLLIYTDARSPKATQLRDHPDGTLVLWSRELGWQLRLRVTLSLQTDGLAVMSRWARLKLTPSAQDYLSPLPPGSSLAQTLPAQVPAIEGRDHFAVVAAVVRSIDWLELDARGHRRAVFDIDPARGGTRWVTP